MLERAAAAVKEDKAKALDMFNNGEGGFKDRDLYVWCANASDGIVTAHPSLKGRTPAGHQRQERLSVRARDHEDRGRRKDQRCYRLVAATRLGRTLREEDLVQEGR